MDSDRHGESRPPPLMRLITSLLIRGREASYIVGDLDASYARDVERGMGRARSMRRYSWNAIASVWSVWSAGLRGTVTRGIGLDAKLGLRILAKQPLVTAVAVLALGLGIPGSLALLHGIDVIYTDFPVPESDRVVGIRHYDLSANRPMLSSLDDFERWAGLTSLQSIGATRSYLVNVNAGEAGALPVRAAEITASAFDVLRARPLRGRLLSDTDEVEGEPDVVLIGEALWSTRFGRDPDIVGTSIQVGRAPHTVVGLMPDSFRFPMGDQVWLPYRARDWDFRPAEGPRTFVFGRLSDGVPVQQAEAEIAGLTEQRAIDDPERFEHVASELVAMPILLLNMGSGIWNQQDMVLIQTLIFALLLVICGNVGTLILARTAARSSEITIRTALGASRARIHSQLFVEALVLTLGATGLGLVLANALSTQLVEILGLSGELPYWTDLTLTPQIVAIALGLAVLCAVVAGVLPALSATRRAIHANLQGASARVGSTPFGVFSSLLIVSQIVLSVGFLSMGAARMRTQLLYQGKDLGFDPERYVVGTLTVPEPSPMDSPSASDSAGWARHVEEAQRELLTRLSEDPLVVSAAMSHDVPGLFPPNRTVILETPPSGFQPVEWDTMIPRVDVSFFAGLRRPILAGRDFDGRDVEGPPGAPHTAVIVNESFVRDFLGGRNAVGQRLRYEKQRGTRWATLDDGEWYEIVGVVGPFGTNPWNSARDAAIYHPLAAGEVNPIRYTVEVAGDPDVFVSRFRQLAATVDPEVTLDSNRLSASIPTGMMSLMVLVFSSAAFLLSAAGLYALISFSVSQRTREIGIRSALGARSVDIVSTVAGRVALQIGGGLALGIGWGWVLLYGERNDITFEVGNITLTLLLTGAVALSICLSACAQPLLRSLRIEPTEALRES